MKSNIKQGAAPNVDRQQIAAVYAKALLGATETSGSTDEVAAEIRSLVAEVLPKFPPFREALVSPRVGIEEKQGLIDRVFGGRATEDFVSFLKVVAAHGRLDAITEIAQAVRKQYNTLRGRIEATVITAEAIPAEQMQSLVTRLEAALGQPIDLNVEIEPNIIGGLVVRVGDTVYDGSIANQLERLRSVALDRTIHKLRQSMDQFATA